MDYFLVYLWTRLDGLGTLLGIVGVFGTIGGLISAIPLSIEANTDSRWASDEYKDRFKGYTKTALKVAKYSAVSLFMALLIPTQQEFAMIYVLPKIAHNQTVKSIGAQSLNIPDKLLKLSNQKLDELLKGASK